MQQTLTAFPSHVGLTSALACLSRAAGGGIQVLGSSARLTRCQVNGNRAFYGGGLDLAAQKDLVGVDTELIVVDSEVKNNAVTDRGGGLLLTSYDTASFTNVTFTNNTGAPTNILRCVFFVLGSASCS